MLSSTQNSIGMAALDALIKLRYAVLDPQQPKGSRGHKPAPLIIHNHATKEDKVVRRCLTLDTQWGDVVIHHPT